MRTFARLATAACAAGALVLGSAVTPAAAGPVPTTRTSWAWSNAVGLASDGRTLSSFPLGAPVLATRVGTVSGLSGDQRLIGIDVRPADRQLYGVGDLGGIYTVNVGNAKARKVSQLTTALAGTSFGVDFNPAADRLRVVSDAGQNLRHDVNPGGATIVDRPLSYANGARPGVTAAAYTNSDTDPATATTLYDIDTRRDYLVEQTPANDGTLTDAGPLRVKVGDVTGFDILTRSAGGAVTNTGFATLRIPVLGNVLFTIDLGTGKARPVGLFARVDVADLAVLIPR